MTAKGNPYTRPPPGVLRSCWIVVEVRKGHDLRDILLRLGTGRLTECGPERSDRYSGVRASSSLVSHEDVGVGRGFGALD